jgi:hypothetical protein
LRSRTDKAAPDAEADNGFSYRISGLMVSSEMELGGAVPVAMGALRPDVSVRFGTVPDQLEPAQASGPTWQMDDDRFLLRAPRVARFLVQDGRRIDVELEPGATARAASPFVLGTAFGVLLHQRGTLVLHGAAVAQHGQAIAICGASGAGKSTLAAALCRDGFDFVADDLCLVALDLARRPVVAPDGRRLKLWRESVDKLGFEDRRGEPVVERIEKFFVDPQTVAAEPPRLTAIYVLRETRPPLEEGIAPLNLPDAMRMLDFQAYRPALRAKMTAAPTKLAQGAAILNHARVFTLTRPRGFEHMADTMAALRDHWDGLRP